MYETCPVTFPSKSSCLGRLSVHWLVVRVLVCCSRVRSVFVACRGTAPWWLEDAQYAQQSRGDVLHGHRLRSAGAVTVQAEVNEHVRAGFGLPIFLQVSCVEVVQLVCGLSLCAGLMALLWGTSGG